MNHIAVIGAGQLCSRDLHSLKKLTEPVVIHIVDPSEQSIANARARIADADEKAMAHQLHFHTKMQTLPEDVTRSFEERRCKK